MLVHPAPQASHARDRKSPYPNHISRGSQHPHRKVSLVTPRRHVVPPSNWRVPQPRPLADQICAKIFDPPAAVRCIVAVDRWQAWPLAAGSRKSRVLLCRHRGRGSLPCTGNWGAARTLRVESLPQERHIFIIISPLGLEVQHCIPAMTQQT